MNSPSVSGAEFKPNPMQGEYSFRETLSSADPCYFFPLPLPVSPRFNLSTIPSTTSATRSTPSASQNAFSSLPSSLKTHLTTPPSPGAFPPLPIPRPSLQKSFVFKLDSIEDRPPCP
jgi:hypothetical protein